MHLTKNSEASVVVGGDQIIEWGLRNGLELYRMQGVGVGWGDYILNGFVSFFSPPPPFSLLLLRCAHMPVASPDSNFRAAKISACSNTKD